MNCLILKFADVSFFSAVIPRTVLNLLVCFIILVCIILFFAQRIKILKSQLADALNKKNEAKELFENAEQLNKQFVQETILEKEQTDLLIAKMSYEIHNCVNGILGMTTLLKDTDLTREQIRSTNVIINCSKKLLESAHESFKTETNNIKNSFGNIKGQETRTYEKQPISKDFAHKYPLSILVAEDDDINKQLATKLLGKLGYMPDIASNGKEALDMVSEKNYDLILMDVLMPEMDGFEATKMIRLCLDMQPVIIAVTASAMAGDKDKCLQAGMDDYICKPIIIDELMPMFVKWAEERKLVYKTS